MRENPGIASRIWASFTFGVMGWEQKAEKLGTSSQAASHYSSKRGHWWSRLKSRMLP